MKGTYSVLFQISDFCHGCLYDLLSDVFYAVKHIFLESKIYWLFIEIRNSSLEPVLISLSRMNSIASTEFISVR